MALPQAGVELVAKGLAGFTQDMNQANQAVSKFGHDGTQSGGMFSKGFTEVVTGGLRQVGAMAVQGLMQAGKAVAGFMSDSIGLAGDFQAGMLEFQAVAGKSVDTAGLEKFHDLFLQIGKDLPVSTADVQKAAIELVKGGIDPATIAAGGLEQTIKFAAAAMDGDLVAAAEISAKVVGGWADVNATAAEKAELLAHAQDVLTKAANASTVGVDDLSLGLYNVQGTAKAMGIGVDETITTLAELAPNFSNANTAGTSFRNFLIRLQPTTDAATGAMQSLGLITEDGSNKFFDAEGKYIGAAKASQLLHDALAGLTDQQKTSLTQTIFGNDGMNAAIALAERGAAGYDNMTASMANANGVADNAALKQSGYNTALDNAKGSVEALQISIGENLLPILTDLLNNYIAPGINAIGSFVDRIFGATDPVLTFAYALGDVSKPLQDIAIWLVEAYRSGDLLNDWLTETPALFQGIIQGVQGAITEFSHLADAFSNGGISGLISTLVADIGAALPSITAALAGWGEALVEWATPYVSQAIDALADFTAQAWTWIQAQAPKWVAQLGAWGLAFIDFVSPYIPPMIKALGDLVQQAWVWVKDQAPVWGRQLQTWSNELIAWIGPMIPPALAELGKLASSLVTWIGDQAAPLVTKLQEWGQSFIAWIPGATVKFLAEWPGVLGRFLDWIATAAGPILVQLAEWTGAFLGWVVKMLPGFMLALAGIALALGTFIVETAGMLAIKIVQWAKAIEDWVKKDVLPRLGPALGEINTAMWAWVTDMRDALIDKMLDVGKNLVAGFQRGISNAWGRFMSWVQDKINQLPEIVRNALGIGSPSKVFAEIGEFSMQGLLLGFQTKLPDVLSSLRSMGDDIASAAQDIGDQINEALSSGFSSEASIDRAKLANLRAMDELSKQSKATAELQLTEAERIAGTMADPKQAAAFYKMRSDQILELAKLQDKIDAATDAKERTRLITEWQLAAAAGDAELKAFQASTANQQNPLQAIMDQIQALLKPRDDGKPLDDPDGALAALFKIYDALAVSQGQASVVNPPAGPGETGGAGGSSFSYTRNLNMPIYTNNTAAAIQQSAAIANAIMP